MEMPYGPIDLHHLDESNDKEPTESELIQSPNFKQNTRYSAKGYDTKESGLTEKYINMIANTVLSNDFEQP
jgi:hypothetical protein